ncbi:glycoside hydrolase family 32 protein [Pseudarthrobacter phenanthrenivorans]|uniref:Glycoside hydrolase family 32 protein n=1 Tax=Pseudarthrobacter phenanthrenivorans TaxID=361575 RepID=A0A3B0FW80_PSEPS|nr:glycoside hydrolase family 32 protein [Pseudarthrobacter phenanthrenivorans]RKO24150.1 glycoside hydrolase family 32 protein [Pseudarthrobacter phenanthrenivorans]
MHSLTTTAGVPSVATAPFSADPFRPAFHYTAERNWLNDPNGLVYLNGTYHLFYQHNPLGPDWGNMSWGHATSTDLLHWEEQPVAIPCDEQEAIFSGSAVFDEHNTSGLGTAANPPLVAIYTSAYSEASPLAGRQAQSLAYSVDEGRTWTKHHGNPVLDRASADFRDPKVFWYDGDAGSYWVMVAVEAVERQVVLYKSADIKSWEYLSTFGPANATGGVWECPDLFELPVDGNPEDTRWVMIVNLNPGGIAGGSAGQYFVGTFDGVTFRSASTVTVGLQPDDSRMREYGWLDWGRDYYAAVSFSNVPDGRRIMIGWMNNWDYARETPTGSWRSAMTLPREVSLTRVEGKVVLRQAAVGPVPKPGCGQFRLGPQALGSGITELPAAEAAARIDAEFEPGAAASVGLLLHAGDVERTLIRYDTADGTLRLDRRESGLVDFHKDFASVEAVGLPLKDGRLRLQIYLDRCSAEVSAQDGLASITDLVFPAEASTAMAIFAEGEGARLVAFDVVEL